ncbi:hypothetical protein VTG60DRAFT_6727 [Thermothelomyces hinnuleus]
MAHSGSKAWFRGARGGVVSLGLGLHWRYGRYHGIYNESTLTLFFFYSCHLFASSCCRCLHVVTEVNVFLQDVVGWVLLLHSMEGWPISNDSSGLSHWFLSPPRVCSSRPLFSGRQGSLGTLMPWRLTMNEQAERLRLVTSLSGPVSQSYWIRPLRSPHKVPRCSAY